MIADIILISFGLILFHLGNKAFNMAISDKRKTDPPSDYSGIEDPKLFLVGIAAMLLGCVLFIITTNNSITFPF